MASLFYLVTMITFTGFFVEDRAHFEVITKARIFDVSPSLRPSSRFPPCPLLIDVFSLGRTEQKS